VYYLLTGRAVKGEKKMRGEKLLARLTKKRKKKRKEREGIHTKRANGSDSNGEEKEKKITSGALILHSIKRKKSPARPIIFPWSEPREKKKKQETCSILGPKRKKKEGKGAITCAGSSRWEKKRKYQRPAVSDLRRRGGEGGSNSISNETGENEETGRARRAMNV